MLCRVTGSTAWLGNPCRLATGSVDHKILIFCCFDFSAHCLSNGSTATEKETATAADRLSERDRCFGRERDRDVGRLGGQFSFMPSALRFLCYYISGDSPWKKTSETEDVSRRLTPNKTPKSATILEFSFLLGPTQKLDMAWCDVAATSCVVHEVHVFCRHYPPVCRSANCIDACAVKWIQIWLSTWILVSRITRFSLRYTSSSELT